LLLQCFCIHTCITSAAIRSAKLPHTYVQFGKLFDKVGTPPQCVTALSETAIADDSSGIAAGTCTCACAFHTDISVHVCNSICVDRIRVSHTTISVHICK
jgi:hypothetical protein